MSPTDVRNINDNFFDGHYKDIWRSIIPEGLTKAETEFIVHESNLQPGKRVLDLMCGYGRHLLALARKGANVTGVDNLAEYVQEVNKVIVEEKLPATISQADVLEFRSADQYDLVICMGNSLSSFDRSDNIKLFSTVASCLRDRCKFIISTWMLTEILARQFVEKSWAYIGEWKCLTDSKYLFFPSRVESEMTMLTADGHSEVKKTVDFIYSLNETEEMLKQSGLVLKEVWSIPGKKKFSVGEPRAYIVAERV